MSDSKSLSSREVLIQACLIALILVLFLLAATLVLKKYHKLFPLPPQSQEHCEYIYQPDDEKGLAICEEIHGHEVETQNKSAQNKKSSKYIKEKRDLNAQEGMWRAANFLVVLTFFQLVIGGITIFLVWSTFRVQKRELNATKQASTLQLQPLSLIHISEPTRPY